MTTGEGFPTQLAFNVCIRCKGRKKKCDKLLPSCTRCTSLGVRCRYDASESSHLPTPPESTSLGSSQVPVYDNRDANVFAEVVTPFTFSVPQPRPSLHPGTRQVMNIDERLTNQAYDIITRDVDDISQSLSRYFETVQGWFPVLVESEVREQLLYLQHTPNADSSALILIIHLVSHMYEDETIHQREGRAQFYISVKELYSITASAKTSSLELVQAGLLLALYEHCQALHDAVYQTLGACARMGYALGLHESICPKAHMDIQTSPDVEKRRHVWWGVIILERISMLEYLAKKIPFAIQSPRPTDLLPSEDGTIHPVSDGITLYGESKGKIPGTIGGYGRLAQSAVLLGYVLDHIIRSDTNSSSCGAASLDNGIRSFAMSLLQLDQTEDRHSAYSLCLSALLTLNCFEISAEPVPEEAHEKELFQARAKLGFQSVLRMIFESIAACSALPKKTSHSGPVWTIHSIFGAVLLSLELGNTDGNEKEWPERLSGLKRMLRSLKTQWKLADGYLKKIEATEAQSGRTETISGQF